jgi:hypothetical protein
VQRLEGNKKRVGKPVRGDEHQNIDEVALVASHRVQYGHKKDTIVFSAQEGALPSEKMVSAEGIEPSTY